MNKAPLSRRKQFQQFISLLEEKMKLMRIGFDTHGILDVTDNEKLGVGTEPVKNAIMYRLTSSKTDTHIKIGITKANMILVKAISSGSTNHKTNFHVGYWDKDDFENPAKADEISLNIDGVEKCVAFVAKYILYVHLVEKTLAKYLVDENVPDSHFNRAFRYMHKCKTEDDYRRVFRGRTGFLNNFSMGIENENKWVSIKLNTMNGFNAFTSASLNVSDKDKFRSRVSTQFGHVRLRLHLHLETRNGTKMQQGYHLAAIERIIHALNHVYFYWDKAFN